MGSRWNSLRQFVAGSPGWSDYLFQAPPKRPDARMVFLGGAGAITALRGALTVFGPIPPQAYLFTVLGDVFVGFWGVAWMIVGLGCVTIAALGHRYPEWDRFSAFLLMTMWWLWGAIYLVSAIWPTSPDNRRLADLLNGGVLVITGAVLSSGVVLYLRKTQEIQLRSIALSRIRQLEADLRDLTTAKTHLELELEQERSGRAD